MRISNADIRKLRPCTIRWQNHLEHAKDWEGDLSEFLDLPHLSHSDKTWVYFRLIPRDKIALVTADIAELVLYLFESKYPDDKRPREAIEAARSGDKVKARAAAYAAYAAYAAAADDDAAAYAAYAAAAAAYAAYAAYAAAAAAAAARVGMQEKQLKIMKAWLLK